MDEFGEGCLAVFFCALLSVLIVVVVISAVDSIGASKCEEMSRTSVYTMEFRSGVCWVLIAQDTWVRTKDLPSYLHLLDPQVQKRYDGGPQ